MIIFDLYAIIEDKISIFFLYALNIFIINVKRELSHLILMPSILEDILVFLSIFLSQIRIF